MRTTLEATGLSKSYGGRQILSGITLTVEKGVVGVAGPNGSGKTTLLKLLGNLLRADSGAVRVKSDGIELAGDERRRAVGFAGPDLAFYDDFTAAENLLFFLRASGAGRDPGRVRRLLDAVGLSSASDRRVGAFSTGMKQRLRLAFAGLFDPPILLLDEPMNALDAAGREVAGRMIEARRREGGVVVASNDPRDFAGADSVVDLSAGKRISGAPEP